MNLFWKSIILVLIATILCLEMSEHNKEYVILITLAVISMLFSVIVTFLEPVFTLFHKLSEIGNINNDALVILIKSLGVSITGEMACQISIDSGNAALGKIVQMLTCFSILYLSLPLFNSLLEILQTILGNL